MTSLFELCIVFSALFTLSIESGSIHIKLTLDEYKSRTCEKALLLNEIFVITGKLTFGQSSDYDDYMNIEWMESNAQDYKLFDTLFFSSCTASQNFYCIRVPNTNDYNIIFNTPAKMEFSHSKWRLQGNYNGKEFQSDILILPNVINPFQVTMTLNGATLSEDVSNFLMIQDELLLCCTDFKLSCEAVITIALEHEVNNKGCVTYIPDLSQQTNYTFGYRLCNVTAYSKKYPLLLEKDSQNVLQSSIDEQNVAKILLTSVVICVIFLALIYLLYLRNKKAREKKSYKFSASNSQIDDFNVEEKTTFIDMDPVRNSPEDFVRTNTHQTDKDGTKNTVTHSRKKHKEMKTKNEEEMETLSPGISRYLRQISNQTADADKKTDVSSQYKRKTY
ncbi:hypothetical protein Btru_041067, partial [Bulinus truncatus]